MALDPANFISELSPSDPPSTDPSSQADDHLRATKKSIIQTFPGTFNGALDLSPTDIEALEGRIAALEAFPLTPQSTPVGGILTVPTSATPIAVTGLGFQPSALMFMTVRPAVGPTQSVSIGMTDGTFTACISTGASQSGGRQLGEYVVNEMYRVQRFDIATVTTSSGAFTSFDADGFTITPTVITEATTLLWQAFE